MCRVKAKPSALISISAVTKYHSFVTWNNMILVSCNSIGQQSNTGLTGLRSKCQVAVFLIGSSLVESALRLSIVSYNCRSKGSVTYCLLTVGQFQLFLKKIYWSIYDLQCCKSPHLLVCAPLSSFFKASSFRSNPSHFSIFLDFKDSYD